MLTNQMRLDSLDHVTGITADAQRCLDFYAGVLGLQFVERSPDFEAPDSHLLRLAPEPGRPEGVLSFIEAAGMGRGRAGDGMVHTLIWRVPGVESVDYWARRLPEAGIEAERVDRPAPGVRFSDPEGLAHELVASGSAPAAPPATPSSAIPAEHAIRRLTGVRSYGSARVPSADILAGRLGFRVTGRDSYEVIGDGRTTAFVFDDPPAGRGTLGAGTVHHVAWAGEGRLRAWRQRAIGMGCAVTPVIDRGHCRSIYFREPSGVLFEIATREDQAASEGRAETDRRLSPKIDPRVRAALV